MDTKHVDGLTGVEEVVPRIVQKVETVDAKLVAFVRERPLLALGTALAVGYLVGRTFSRLA
jgi:ElaB/YqjD/DUF883 family membrane-anchored ribosome-binding protein